MNKNTYQINQIALISAITNELNRQVPGLAGDDRFNAIIKAADMIVAEYAREPVVENLLLQMIRHDEVMEGCRFMLLTLCNQFTRHYAHPSGPVEFGRCVQTFDLLRELGKASSLDSMLECGEHWRAIVDNWSVWRQMYERGKYAELHDAMQEAYALATSD